MLKEYLLVALRHFRKNLLSFIINILGLAIGMTAFILIMQFVRFELNYDNFHENEDRIFRIQQDRYNKGELTTQWAAGCSAVGQARLKKTNVVLVFLSLHQLNRILG